MNKLYKPMVNAIEAMIGTEATGIILAGIADAFREISDGKAYAEVRSFKLVVNNFFEYELLHDGTKRA